MDIKLVDTKGRVSLGAEFAGKTVIVEKERGRIIIKPAVVIPESEAWLFANEEAKAAVLRGLEDARKGRFSKNPPNVSEDAKLDEDHDS